MTPIEIIMTDVQTLAAWRLVGVLSSGLVVLLCLVLWRFILWSLREMREAIRSIETIDETISAATMAMREIAIELQEHRRENRQYHDRLIDELQDHMRQEVSLLRMTVCPEARGNGG